jgi:hypothetical protein
MSMKPRTLAAVLSERMATRCLTMGADHLRWFVQTGGASRPDVGYLERVRDQPAFVQGIHDPLAEPRQGPAPELAVDRRPRAELFRQVTARRAGAGDPEHPVQNKTMVQGFASVRGADCPNDAFMERPLLVRHQIWCQAGPDRRSQLESRSARPVSPFCQHSLDTSLATAEARKRSKSKRYLCQNRTLPERRLWVAEAVGFEPTERSPVRSVSNRVLSASQPRLRYVCFIRVRRAGQGERLR